MRTANYHPAKLLRSLWNMRCTPVSRDSVLGRAVAVLYRYPDHGFDGKTRVGIVRSALSSPLGPANPIAGVTLRHELLPPITIGVAAFAPDGTLKSPNPNQWAAEEISVPRLLRLATEQGVSVPDQGPDHAPARPDV
jgi:hypothetical protein